MANIASFLKAQVVTPERALYRQFVDGAWRDFAAREIAAYAARWQAFMRSERMTRGDRVALCMKNSVHWVAADQAALGLGLVVVPLYADDNPDNVAWCLQNSEARLVIVETSRTAAALKKTSAALPPVHVLRPEGGD